MFKICNFWGAIVFKFCLENNFFNFIFNGVKICLCIILVVLLNRIFICKL